MASFQHTVALIFLVLVGTSFAAKPLGAEVCVASCYYSLLGAKFAVATNDTKKEAACTHPLRVKSTFYCIASQCKEDETAPGIEWWAATCKKSKKAVNLPAYRAAVANVSVDYINRLPTVEIKHKKIVNETVRPSEHNWFVVHRSVKTYSDMRDYASDIRWAPYGFWAFVLLAGMAWRAYMLSLHKRKPSDKQTTLDKMINWFRFRIQVSPTFKRHHYEPYGWFSIPLRLQSIAILSYIVMQIILCAVHYPVYDESYYYSNRPAQALRYFSDRLGTLMSSSLPFIFLFAARSNPFIFLTGWSYKVFSLFHRWISIVLVIEGIVHGAAFSAQYVNDKGWPTYRDKLAHEPKFLYGIMMTVALGLSSFFALSEIRKRFYEFFKATHIVLAAVFMAAFYQHVKEQFKGVYKVWCWVCIALWASDYMIRIVRLVFVNYKMLLRRDTPAIASYNQDTDMIRLQVYASTMAKTQTPGKYYFLYFGGMRFWQAHPFSLAGVSVPTTETVQSSEGKVADKQAVAAVTQITPPHAGLPYLTFMIRPRDGVTKNLRDQITAKAESGQCRLRVMLEGPYGSAVNLDGFNNILFIAGGSGISAIVPYIRRIFEDSTNDSKPNVKLVWAARKEGFVRDVLANDLSCAEGRPSFTQQFYITADASASTSKTSSIDEGNSGRSDERFVRQRLQVDELVNTYLEQAHGSTAVFICAPARMADDARVAVIDRAKKQKGDVQLFEEMYGW